MTSTEAKAEHLLVDGKRLRPENELLQQCRTSPSFCSQLAGPFQSLILWQPAKLPRNPETQPRSHQCSSPNFGHTLTPAPSSSFLALTSSLLNAPSPPPLVPLEMPARPLAYLHPAGSTSPAEQVAGRSYGSYLTSDIHQRQLKVCLPMAVRTDRPAGVEEGED